MQIDDVKIINGFTVTIHEITDAAVYFACYLGSEWGGDPWPLYKMARAEFERWWEAA